MDGLRALCALAVMLEHWGPLRWANTLDPGGVGVGFFFVISGFLITGILLDSRDSLNSKSDFWSEIRTFYIRRSLRIFPVYYAVLLGCVALIALGHLRKIDGLPWHFFYLSNAYIFIHQKFPPLVFHFWSLSVEEQFYLLWPAIVLLTPKRVLKPLILSMIALACGVRLVLTLAGFDWATQASPLLPTCLDSLGIGALLAVLAREFRLGSRVLVFTGAIGVAGYTAIVLLASAYGWKYASIPSHISVGLIAFSFLGMIVFRQHSMALAWLNWQPLQYLGRISYGLYLYHQFVAYAVDNEAPRFVHHDLPLWPRFAICLLLNVATASASWFLLEKPVLSLKRRFVYDRRRSKPETEAVLKAA